MYANVLHTNRNIVSQSFGAQQNNLQDLCAMSFLIGEKIKNKIQEKGWTTTRFAKEANMSYRNAMHLFKRGDISVEQLIQISKILDYNFMKEYVAIASGGELASLSEESAPDDKGVPKDFTTMIISLTVGGSQHTFERLPELVRKFRKQATDLGFKVI
jgi:transcriptional regulator with XRE-family HTH domain